MKRRIVLQGLLAWPVAMTVPMPAIPFAELKIIFDKPLEVPAIPAADLTLTIEEFARKYINPAMKAVVDSVDRHALEALYGGDQWTAEELEKIRG